MDAYIIIGNRNTRKASLVRSLTGCVSRSVRDIQLQAAKKPQRFYVRVGTLQDTRVTVEQFIAEVSRSRAEAVLFCLSPDPYKTDTTEFPGAQAYLTALRERGWRIQAVAVLGQNTGGISANNLRQYITAPTAPVNVTARDVRAQFGWV